MGPVWYALVQDEQLGPMSMQELGELFTQGVVTVDTFIWREGMAEWKPLTQVDEFLEITNAVVMDLADHGGPIAEPGDEDDEDD
ncbi:MAG: DUF4339 domain-containing protein, partial [Myxococcales bacterium]|nr:DUF4339 domain-containing protein [Myxococcales bacterium]